MCVQRSQCCGRTLRGPRDFYRHVCLALGLSPSATAAGVFCAINTYVNALGANQVHPVLLIDEAHLLRQDVLSYTPSRRTTESSNEPPRDAERVRQHRRTRRTLGVFSSALKSASRSDMKRSSDESTSHAAVAPRVVGPRDRTLDAAAGEVYHHADVA